MDWASTFSKLSIQLSAYTNNSISYFKNMPIDILLKTADEIKEVYKKRGGD